MVSVIEIFQSVSLYSCCFLCARFNDASIINVREVSLSYRSRPAFNRIRKCRKYLFLRARFRMLLKNKQTFSLKQPKAMPACRGKKRVLFPFYILLSKLLKSSNIFSHIQSSAVKRKYPTLIVRNRVFKIQRHGRQRECQKNN